MNLSKIIAWQKELLPRLMLGTSKNPLTYPLVSLITLPDGGKAEEDNVFFIKLQRTVD